MVSKSPYRLRLHKYLGRSVAREALPGLGGLGVPRALQVTSRVHADRAPRDRVAWGTSPRCPGVPREGWNYQCSRVKGVWGGRKTLITSPREGWSPTFCWRLHRVQEAPGLRLTG